MINLDPDYLDTMLSNMVKDVREAKSEAEQKATIQDRRAQLMGMLLLLTTVVYSHDADDKHQLQRMREAIANTGETLLNFMPYIKLSESEHKDFMRWLGENGVTLQKIDGEYHVDRRYYQQWKNHHDQSTGSQKDSGHDR